MLLESCLSALKHSLFHFAALPHPFFVQSSDSARGAAEAATSEEEEEEDLFVFNNTIEGPRAPKRAREGQVGKAPGARTPNAKKRASPPPSPAQQPPSPDRTRAARASNSQLTPDA